jgi:hypothetical protein
MEPSASDRASFHDRFAARSEDLLSCVSCSLWKRFYCQGILYITASSLHFSSPFVQPLSVALKDVTRVAREDTLTKWLLVTTSAKETYRFTTFLVVDRDEVIKVVQGLWNSKMERDLQLVEVEGHAPLSSPPAAPALVSPPAALPRPATPPSTTRDRAVSTATATVAPQSAIALANEVHAGGIPTMFFLPPGELVLERYPCWLWFGGVNTYSAGRLFLAQNFVCFESDAGTLWFSLPLAGMTYLLRENTYMVWPNAIRCVLHSAPGSLLLVFAGSTVRNTVYDLMSKLWRVAQVWLGGDMR